MNATRRALLATGLSAALPLPALRPAAAEPSARLALLHLNDFHSKHEGVDAGAAACRADRPCLGGSARLATALSLGRRDAAAAGRTVLQLDAGDQFMGSLFYTAHKGMTEAAVQRATGTEVMALGNHEFDHGPAVLAGYAAAVPFPLLSANLDTSREPLLAGRIRPHVVLNKGGARIGIIGLTTETTPQGSSPGPTLRFTNAAEAAERAIAELRAQGPITIIILSHLGLEADRRLAASVAGIDLIAGGHSHSLLADGLAGAAGPHPTMVGGRDRDVRILQSGCHGRWLGRLDLDLAAGGRIAAHAGAVREITPELEPDPQVAEIVARHAAPLAEWRARPIGSLAQPLTNAGCRDGECALGNLLADAMLAAEPQAEIALTNGGGLRANLPGGTVTWGDVLGLLPFSSTLATLTIRGGALRAALENGLSLLGRNGGRFPQVAGLRLRFDPAAPVGQRVREVEVQQDGRFVPLDPDRAYRVVTSNFLRQGGDGYAELRDQALEAYDNGPALEDMLAGYLADRPGLAVAVDGRLRPS
ncbi:bifunctional metallophosphatase/5'-nucleotidase [Roseomonas marmotae]|uniref:Bifunctional metallophosphatase/5'-nucleotidase n=1 Tax=Roseomonas marmotae TaxID=2768161 RepID=A0ABS3KBX0_9PROT|nr:bifunctional UDP-sugar hydrolase/5'-nucleotidase [Roseomonas marmotae]MBO1074964.1 bifunctional metallophosphatase/5'-nucleotidase [Roseomonas marmotae]QTI79995.1 bifunctional metallophosphatase/5'-nucleotidase [Roseomonas marmotae]